jgi:hypothetical protein
VNFTNPPNVAMVAKVSDFLLFCDSMSLSSGQKSQAQTNLGVAPINGWVDTNYLSASGTVTIPAGATRARIRLWGGTGGGHTGSCCNQGGSGGGAGYLEKKLTGLTPGNTFALTVGAAGVAAGAGGNTSLASGTQTIATLTANGGGGGGGSTGGAAGTASGGDLNIPGQPGVPGGVGGLTGAAMSYGGQGSTASVGIVGGCIIDWYS